MESALFEDPICILLLCCVCWPGNERYRQAAALSGQQATLGFSSHSSAPFLNDQMPPGAFYSFPEMNLPDVAHLILLARQKTFLSPVDIKTFWDVVCHRSIACAAKSTAMPLGVSDTSLRRETWIVWFVAVVVLLLVQTGGVQWL